MKLYKFSDGADQMWIADAKGRDHQIASVGFALEGVDVTEITDAQAWAQAYAEQHASITNEQAAGAQAEIERLESEIEALDADDEADYLAQLRSELRSAKTQAQDEMDEGDISEMARHIVMLIEYRQREMVD